MQNIDLIAIGKMNAAYFAQGVAEYQKRLGGFCNFRIIELPSTQSATRYAPLRTLARIASPSFCSAFAICLCRILI